jgi:hypothetical protein
VRAHGPLQLCGRQVSPYKRRSCGGLSGGENYPGRSKGKSRAELGFGSSQKTRESLLSGRSTIKTSIKMPTNIGVTLLLPIPPCPPPNSEEKLPPPIGGTMGEIGCGVPFEEPSTSLVGEEDSEDPLRKPPRTLATLVAVSWSVFTAVVAAACKPPGRTRDTSSTAWVTLRPAAIGFSSGITAEDAGCSVGEAFTGPSSTRGAGRSIGADESAAAVSSGAVGSGLLSLGVSASDVIDAGLEECDGVEPTGGPGIESGGVEPTGGPGTGSSG